jgi:hypothetical protein
MDGIPVDPLSRQVLRHTSRRRLIQLLAALACGGMLASIADPTAADARKKGKKRNQIQDLAPAPPPDGAEPPPASPTRVRVRIRLRIRSRIRSRTNIRL